MFAVGILITGQGMADQYRIAFLAVQCAPGLVGDTNRSQHLAGLQPDGRTARQFDAWTGKVILDFVDGFGSLGHVELNPLCRQQGSGQGDQRSMDAVWVSNPAMSSFRHSGGVRHGQGLCPCPPCHMGMAPGAMLIAIVERHTGMNRDGFACFDRKAITEPLPDGGLSPESL